ncbi:MAG: hypothetical protein FJ191_12825 [Gammaproteobacteria bacterium]|nr:hypothetical protein [Gammaproteobacteria bacterium]
MSHRLPQSGPAGRTAGSSATQREEASCPRSRSACRIRNNASFPGSSRRRNRGRCRRPHPLQRQERASPGAGGVAPIAPILLRVDLQHPGTGTRIDIVYRRAWIPGWDRWIVFGVGLRSDGYPYRSAYGHTPNEPGAGPGTRKLLVEHWKQQDLRALLSTRRPAPAGLLELCIQSRGDPNFRPPNGLAARLLEQPGAMASATALEWLREVWLDVSIGRPKPHGLMLARAEIPDS